MTIATPRSARVILVTAALTLMGMCALAGSAQAASPAWKLLAATGPTYLPPTQSEVQRVTVEAEGGTFALSRATGEGGGRSVAGEGHLTFDQGATEATIVDGEFEVGFGVTGSGVGFENTVVACSVDCLTPGSTLTFAKPTAQARVNQKVNVINFELTEVTGSFSVGDVLNGTFIRPDTVVTAVGAGTLSLSKPPTVPTLLSFKASQVTAPIPYDASAVALQAALDALPSSTPGMFTVTGGPGGDAEHPYFIAYGDSLAEEDAEELVVDGSALVGENAAVHIFTVVSGGPGTGEITINPANVGGAPTSGEYTLALGPLPTGIVITGEATGLGWSCSVSAGGETVTCTGTQPVPPLTPTDNVRVPIKVLPGAAPSSSAPVTITGGAGSASFEMPIVVSSAQAHPGAQAFWAGAFDEDGNPETQAGGHPYSAGSYFLLNTVRSANGRINPAGDSKTVIVDLPPGFGGNPMVTPRCPQSQLTIPGSGGSPSCNMEMSVGVFSPMLARFGASALEFAVPIFNNVPAHGYAAQFTTKVAQPQQPLLGSVRSSGDYGVRITAPNNPTFSKIYGSFATLEGLPAGGKGKAFMLNPTDCAEEARRAPVATFKSDTWQQPGRFSLEVDQVLPPVTGCEKLEFHPSFSFQPTSTSGSSPVGVTAHLHIPQDGISDPAKLRTPDLKKAVVTLPEGLNINPSSAHGLEACSEEQIGFLGNDFELPNPIRFDESAPRCPDGSKLGTARIETPLLEAPLGGTIYLATPHANPFGSLIALYLVIDDERTGITMKLPGEVRLDQVTGQVTATFDHNPQLPFEDMTLHFRGGGPRSELATPEICGDYATNGSWTPWSAPESGPPAQTTDGFTVQENCAPTPAARPFAPSFEAGTIQPKAGDYSPLVIKLARRDGEQELTRLQFTMPPGLTGKLAGVSNCPEAAIAAATGKSGKAEIAMPSCPVGSRLGSVDAAAGVGSDPFHVGGQIYLAGPYRGAPISAVVITPAVAGPFDLGNVVIRSPLHVDPKTAQITAASDPIPTILEGIPLKVRSVTISIDRPQFTLNPTNCEAMSVEATVSGGSGAMSKPRNRFQVGSCGELAFKPRISLRLKGGTSRGAYPSLRAVVRPRPGDANISGAAVTLPRSAFLEQGHIRTICTRVQWEADSCPKAARYGYARAWSPLLDYAVRGPVYLRSSDNKLPDLVADLRGPANQPIKIEAGFRIDSIKGGIRSTLDVAPDVPVSRFVLRMQGGQKGLIVNSRNLCGGKNRAKANLKAHNGRVSKSRPVVRAVDCKGKRRKAKSSAHKRSAKRLRTALSQPAREK